MTDVDTGDLVALGQALETNAPLAEAIKQFLKKKEKDYFIQIKSMYGDKKGDAEILIGKCKFISEDMEFLFRDAVSKFKTKRDGKQTRKKG